LTYRLVVQTHEKMAIFDKTCLHACLCKCSEQIKDKQKRQQWRTKKIWYRKFAPVIQTHPKKK